MCFHFFLINKCCFFRKRQADLIIFINKKNSHILNKNGDSSKWKLSSF